MHGRLTIFKTKTNAILLTAFAAACTLAVSLTYILTAPVIEVQKQNDLLNKLTEVLDQKRFDNNPLHNCVAYTSVDITGYETQQTVYRATKEGLPYALILPVKTEQGYSGRIEMLVAIDNQGVVQGVRTLTHKETPGLGDKIELAKSDWILDFNGKSPKAIDDSTWFVKKDGGNFDQFTGATITPRSMVNQLRTSISNLKLEFDDIFALPNACEINQEQPIEVEANNGDS